MLWCPLLSTFDQVSLKNLSAATFGDPTQLWLFDPIRDSHRKIQQKLELGPSYRVYRYGSSAISETTTTLTSLIGSHGYLSGLIHYFGSSSDVASVVIEPDSPEDLVKIVSILLRSAVLEARALLTPSR